MSRREILCSIKRHAFVRELPPVGFRATAPTKLPVATSRRADHCR
jgi:hypothetical protein